MVELSELAEPLYSQPENIMEIRVKDPCTQVKNKEKYTDYEIYTKVL